VSVSASVRPSVTFVHSIKTNKDIFEIFSPSGSATILGFFCTKLHGNIPTGTPLTEASNAGWVDYNLNSERISGFAIDKCCTLVRILHLATSLLRVLDDQVRRAVHSQGCP